MEALFGSDDSAIAFDWNPVREDWKPLYNIAPTDSVVVLQRPQSKLVAGRLPWGVPNPKRPGPLINARSETAATSPLFADSFERHRCLLPADGFFEWQRRGFESQATSKQARLFHRDGRPFLMGGIVLDLPNAKAPGTVVLTTRASATVAPFHDRMPVLINASDTPEWLDAGTPRRRVEDILMRASDVEWQWRPVGPAVNDARNKTAACIAGPNRGDTQSHQARLF